MEQAKVKNLNVLKSKLEDIIGIELDINKVYSIIVEVMNYQSCTTYEKIDKKQFDADMFMYPMLLFMMGNKPWQSNNPCTICPMMMTVSQVLSKIVGIEPPKINFPATESVAPVVDILNKWKDNLSANESQPGM